MNIDTNYTYETEIPDALLADLPEEARDQENINRVSFTYWQTCWKRMKKDRLAMFGIVVIIVMAILAVFGPVLCPYSYDDADFMAILQGPSLKHWFGTDGLGRDVFVRTLYGARISLTIGFVAAIVNMVIGVLYGGIAGYLGGWADLIMMRIVDILSGIPSLIYLILIMMFLGSSVQSILLAMCLTYWITTARMVRGQIFTLREQDYALAAKVCGQTKWQILIHHLIPNSMGSIIVTMTFLIPSAIFEEAFLSFLGIGIQYLTQQPWLMIFPALAISITIFSRNFIGDGLRDALDPRINKQ